MRQKNSRYENPGFGISVTFVVLLAAVVSLLFIWLITYALKLGKRGAVSGKDSILGGVGTAMEDFTGEGKVWLEGEAWTASSSAAIQKDQQVVVRAMNGLVLDVEAKTRSGTDDA